VKKEKNPKNSGLNIMQTKHKWFKQKCISKEKEKIEMVEEKLSFHKN